jgi:hypothetical protein
MTAIDAHTAGGILGGVGVVLGYGFSLWRIFQRNRGDRFVECALVTTMLLVVVSKLPKFPIIPNWVGPALWPLLFVFCVLSLFFLLQQGWRALRDRKASSQERKTRAAIPMPISGALRIFLVGAAGALISLVISSLIPAPRPPSVLEPTLTPESPDLVGYMFRLQHFLFGPYVIFPWFLAMVYLAISKREQPKSWTYALLAGLSFPGIIFHYVLHWI